jgi:dTDP-4-amino-4,6-dideoxygalactose transaminase
MLDCSQSLSYRHKQRNVVSCADICISRLQPLLNLPIEGAVCFTQDSLLSERMSGMRSLPTSCNHKSAYSGVESHLDPLLAMLWQQYKMILPVERQHTAIISAYYTSHLKDLPNLTLIDKDSSSSHYIILHPQAKQLQQYLQTCNIHSLLPWQLPVPCQPAFADCLSQVLHLSNLLRITSSALALPLYPELSEQQLLCVVDGVKEFCNNWKGDT